MSEVKLSAVPEKPKRTLEGCQQEYQSLCMQAGHIQYQIDALGKDLKTINETLRDVNFDAKKLQDEEKAKKESELVAAKSQEAAQEAVQS